MSERAESILIVDDEPQILVALEDLLSDEYVVLKAQTGAQALELAKRNADLAVVVTDEHMPEIRGDELLHRLRGTSDATRILLTAFADLPAAVRAMNDGAIFAYVTKPWNEHELRVTVANAVEHRRRSRELTDKRERLRASERRLLKQTGLLDSILDSVGDGMVVASYEHDVLVFNQHAAEILGPIGAHKLSEAWPTFGVYSLDGAEPVAFGESPPGRAAAEKRMVEAELFVTGTAGRRRLISMTATPLRVGPGEETAGVVTLLRDITRQREIEQTLLQAQKLDAVGQFASGVVHDFNNLISVIQSYAQLILNDWAPPRITHDAEQIIGASERAAALTRQLLAFCRKQEIVPRLVQLDTIVRDLQKLLQRLLGGGLALHIELAPDLGAVKADAGQLEQLIMNLAANARDAMPIGGSLTISAREVKVTAADPKPQLPPGDYVRLRVADTGVGMSPETKQRIFEPFFTTKEEGRGTGLGLATVHGMVQEWGGQIEVDSAPGEGTTFTIYLPRAGDRVRSSPTEREPVLKHLRRGKILLVEDNEPVRTVAARILSGDGYVVLEAGTIDEARRLAAEHGREIDLLLFDVVVPRVSGPSLARELADVCGHPKVLFMSGLTSVAPGMAPAANHGAKLLQKPFTPESLLEKVGETLAGDDG